MAPGPLGPDLPWTCCFSQASDPVFWVKSHTTKETISSRRNSSKREAVPVPCSDFLPSLSNLFWRLFLGFCSLFKFLTYIKAKERSLSPLEVPVAMIICAIHLIIDPGNPCTVALNCYFSIVLVVNFSYSLPAFWGRPEVSVGQELFYIFP